MATISFYAGGTAVNNISGSGLGFFGGSFGQSVEINKFQDTTLSRTAPDQSTPVLPTILSILAIYWPLLPALFQQLA